MNPRQLRESTGLTQVELGKRFGKNASQISKIETQSDWKVSTLRAYVRALGGELVIAVRWPDPTKCGFCGVTQNVHNPDCTRG